MFVWGFDITVVILPDLSDFYIFNLDFMPECEYYKKKKRMINYKIEIK